MATPLWGVSFPSTGGACSPVFTLSYTSSSRVWLSVTLAALGTAVAPTLCHRLPPGSCPPHSANCSHNTALQFLLPLPGPPCHTRPVGSPHFFRDSPVLLYPRKVSSLPVTFFCFSWRPQLKLMAPPPPPKSLGLGLTTCEESNMSF